MEFRVGSRQLSARKRKLSPKIEESPDKCPKFVDIQISSWSFTLHLFNPLRKTRSFGSFSNGTVDVVFRAYARKHGSTSITWKPPVMGWRVLRCHCVVRRKPGATWCPAIRTKSISRCGLWSLKMEGCFCLTLAFLKKVKGQQGEIRCCFPCL